MRGVRIVSTSFAGFEDPPWVLDFILGFGREEEGVFGYKGDSMIGSGSAAYTGLTFVYLQRFLKMNLKKLRISYRNVRQ